MTETTNDEAKDSPIDEPIELTEDVLEQLLLGCYWDIVRRMREVSLGKMTADEASEADDALARHLARSLMGENPGFVMKIPFMGETLIEIVKGHCPEQFTDDALAGIETANPRAMMVYVCRLFVRDCYFSLTAVGSSGNITLENLQTESMSRAALWRKRLTQRANAVLN